MFSLMQFLFFWPLIVVSDRGKSGKFIGCSWSMNAHYVKIPKYNLSVSILNKYFILKVNWKQSTQYADIFGPFCSNIMWLAYNTVDFLSRLLLVGKSIVYNKRRDGLELKEDLGSRRAFMRWRVFALPVFSWICHLAILFSTVNQVFILWFFVFAKYSCSLIFPNFLGNVIGLWLMCMQVMKTT